MITESASRLRCKTEKLLLMYLGLLLGGYPKCSLFWQPIIDKIQGKLSKWRRYNLSRGGRITQCKSVLSNLPTYYISTLLMPISVSNTSEKIMRKLLWEGNTGGKLNHLAKWSKIIKSQIDGASA